MRVEIIEGSEAIERLRPEWDAIYDADPEAHYFLSWSWLNGYLAPWGREAFVLAARPDTDGASYVALLPLRLRTKERSNTEFCNEINLAGNYISDYAGFLCRPGFEEQALPALAAKVQQLNWRRLRLENFCASEQRAELFLRGFSADTFETTQPSLVNPDGTDNSICPSVTLPEDWDRISKPKSVPTRARRSEGSCARSRAPKLGVSPTRMPIPLHAISTSCSCFGRSDGPGKRASGSKPSSMQIAARCDRPSQRERCSCRSFGRGIAPSACSHS